MPAEKHRLLRGAVYLIGMIDGPNKNAFRHKLLRKERFAKYLKRNPVPPHPLSRRALKTPPA